MMKHEIFFDEAKGVLKMKIGGTLTPQEVSESFDIARKLLEGKTPRYILTDLSRHEGNLDKATRQAIKEKGLDVEFDRQAFVGTSPVTRMMGKMLMAMLGKSKTPGFFETEAEAIVWLKGARR
jgi:hypothetical protein